MPLPAILLLAAALFPLLGFCVLVPLGHRMGNPLAGFVGTAFIVGSFICSVLAMMFWVARPDNAGWGYEVGPIVASIGWIPTGIGIAQAHAGYLDVGIHIDSLTIVMFNMVSLVATLVYIFSLGYMQEDIRFARFFTYLSLFCFSMLALVLSSTLLQLLIFWELVGLCSYLLIGFWFEKSSASNAAIKAFVTNRVGDMGFIVGLGILFCYLGNVTLTELWIALGNAGSGAAITLENGAILSPNMLTMIGICLFCGAIGKSAQFPLHVWLPDAMEGPTPVSALIHAATMVAGGVYLVARIFPLLTPDAKLFIAIIGCVTLTLASLIAIAQSDIKRLLAFSTIAQLGYMMLAIGIGSWVGGLFHLITHAFFKALLFLSAASVIRAAHHEQEMSRFGGLIKKIPVTAVTFGIGVLAIAGTPFFAGYYSKDLILSHAAMFGLGAQAAHQSSLYWLLFSLPTICAYLTAFYMMRCWMLTFWGKPRDKEMHERASETPIMWIPLGVLAVLSIIGGQFLGVREFLNAAIVETNSYCSTIDPRFAGFSTTWPAPSPQQLTIEDADAAPNPSEQLLVQGEALMQSRAGWAWLIGILAGAIIYARGYAITDRLLQFAPLRWLHVWLYRRMFFDELYFSVYVAIVTAVVALCAWFDAYIVDGLVNAAGWITRGMSIASEWSDRTIVDGAVDEITAIAQDFGAAVRTPQTGRIRVYVAALFVVVTIGLAGTVIAVMVH